MLKNIIIQEKIKTQTLQEKIDQISKSINLEETKKSFVQDIHNLKIGNLFFFDSESIEYIVIDGIHYYSFEAFYYNKYYKNTLIESKINYIRDVLLLKKVIVYVSKKNKNYNPDLNFYDVLDLYLKTKIKYCYRIICLMMKKIREMDNISDLSYVDKYLIFFISKYFVINEEK